MDTAGAGGAAGAAADASGGTAPSASGGTAPSGGGGMPGTAGAGGATPGAGGRAAGGATGAPPSKPVTRTCAVTPGTAPASTWVNRTANLAGLPSECGNLTLLAADPCSGRVIAGVAKGGLWATDGGDWTKLGSGAGSASIEHRPSSVVFDPEHPAVFYESGIYGNFADGIYLTKDGGETFEQLGNIGHNDAVSVDFSDPDRQTLFAGAHEQKQKLYRSRDGGQTWTDIGKNLPDGSHFSSEPLVLDRNHVLLGACGWGDGTCGVFASEDGGETWKTTSSESPAGQPLWATDGHILWTTIWDSGVIQSKDLGQTWSAKVGGPHTGAPIELPNGHLLAGAGDHAVLSKDGGTTWTQVGEKLPFSANGMTYSVATKTIYAWHNDCGNAVLADAVMSAGFDFEQ